MANILVKRGQLDNVATYEHFCDITADMENIDPNQINLGSACIVLEGESGGIEVYLANSEKQWIQIGASGNSNEPSVSL